MISYTNVLVCNNNKQQYNIAKVPGEMRLLCVTVTVNNKQQYNIANVPGEMRLLCIEDNVLIHHVGNSLVKGGPVPPLLNRSSPKDGVWILPVSINSIPACATASATVSDTGIAGVVAGGGWVDSACGVALVNLSAFGLDTILIMGTIERGFGDDLMANGVGGLTAGAGVGAAVGVGMIWYDSISGEA